MATPVDNYAKWKAALEDNAVYEHLVGTRHSYDKLKELIETIPNFVHRHYRLTDRSIGGNSLTVHIIAGDYACVKLLLENKADPNVYANHRVPLTCSRKASITKLLLDYGADPNFTLENGSTPLFTADYNKAKLLIEYKANVNHINYGNATALSYSVSDEDPKTTKLLLKHGADPNIRSITGEYPLNYAKNDVTQTRLLLKYKADPSLVLVNDARLYKPTPDVFALLLDHTPDLYITDKYGRTILQRLMYQDYYDELYDDEDDVWLDSYEDANTGDCVRLLLERMSK